MDDVIQSINFSIPLISIIMKINYCIEKGNDISLITAPKINHIACGWREAAPVAARTAPHVCEFDSRMLPRLRPSNLL